MKIIVKIQIVMY